MTITEQKFLLKGRAAKELALAVQDNASDEAQDLRDFFKIAKAGRAKSGLMTYLDQPNNVAALSEMVNAAPFGLPPDSRNRPEKVLISIYCSGNTPKYYYYNNSTGKYETSSVAAGDYGDLCTGN